MRIKYIRIIAGVAFLLTLSVRFSTAVLAADPRTFPSPNEAMAALVAAARAGDRAALEGIFGSDSRDLFFSGDDVADLKALATFSEWADQSAEVVEHDDGSAEIVVGDEEWPLPIPLVKDEGGWRFDTAAGKEEIINRRIGENELSAIDICRAFVEAQTIYASKDRDGDGVKEYAQKILSDDGKQNGLYWNASQHGDEVSPIGPFAARATEEGYKGGETARVAPYHGYFFRLLKKQGENAPGDKEDYVVDGNMTRGFALKAYPAEYGVSGVMTFLINRNGILFQKDLGTDTEKLAGKLDTYDPDETWTIVKD